MWKSDETPLCGVLQLVHGMTEYVDRYDEFARFMAERGFAVIGHDHLGHGKTAASEADYGYFNEDQGNAMLLQDIRRLTSQAKKKYPGVPYFILGHSMGSFLVRQYLCRYGDLVDGAVIMGTGKQPKAALQFGRAVCWAETKLLGSRYRSRSIYFLAFGGYCLHFKPCRTRYDWLTKDTDIVDAYGADPLCTFRYTLNGYRNLFYSISEASRMKNLQKMPKTLPILLVSGTEDPVGNYGKGVEQVYRLLQKAGMSDLTKILYPGDRHEILNETDRKEVFQDIYAWLSAKMQAHRDQVRKGHKEE